MQHQENMTRKKSIIFCAPADYGFSDIISDLLRKSDFEVYDFPIQNEPFKYKSIFQRLHNLYRKVVFRDYTYKLKLKNIERTKNLLTKLNNTPKTDYAFIIRADQYSETFVKTVKDKSNKMVGYQWDGLERFPNIANYIDLFDRFFVFDRRDINKHANILPITNFFINKSFKKTHSNSVYFIATFDDYRFDLIQQLKPVFESLNLKSNLQIITYKKEQNTIVEQAGFTVGKPIDYKENILQVENSSILVDIHVPSHSGLSFRIFEALYYGKKIITTNISVKDYDFYHPNNIFIWDKQNEYLINDFLDLDYVEIPQEIKRKYSFENWINYALDIENHIPIDLPLKNNYKKAILTYL